MIGDLSWIFAFNVIINSLLSFLTVFVLVKLGVRIFCVKNPRYIAWIAALPVFKIIVDPILYSYGQWALLNGINPLYAESGTRCFMLGVGFQGTSFMPCTYGLGFLIDDLHGFTIADGLALSLPSSLMKWIVSFVLAISAFRTVRFWCHHIVSKRFWKVLIKGATDFPFCLNSKPLRAEVEKMGVKLLVSHHIHSPLATGVKKRIVMLPEEVLNSWTQGEIEAAIAHELEHHKYFDPFLLYVLRGIGEIFWWVPIRWAIHRFEEACEFHCDQSVYLYDMKPTALAQALLRLAKKRVAVYPSEYCALCGSSSFKNRVCCLLEQPAVPKASVVKSGVVGLLATGIVMAKLWLF